MGEPQRNHQEILKTKRIKLVSMQGVQGSRTVKFYNSCVVNEHENKIKKVSWLPNTVTFIGMALSSCANEICRMFQLTT